MKKYTLYDITRNLLGDIEPVGATHVDTERLDNLEGWGDFVVELVEEITTIALIDNEMCLRSVDNAKLKANNILQEIKEVINGTTN